MPRSVKRKDFHLEESSVVTVGTTIDLINLRTDLAHCFVGIQFFADAAGTIPAVPGAGTVTVTIETINNENVFESVPDNVITASAGHTVTYDANTLSVKLVPAGITTATHMKAVWTAHRT